MEDYRTGRSEDGDDQRHHAPAGYYTSAQVDRAVSLGAANSRALSGQRTDKVVAAIEEQRLVRRGVAVCRDAQRVVAVGQRNKRSPQMQVANDVAFANKVPSCEAARRGRVVSLAKFVAYEARQSPRWRDPAGSTSSGVSNPSTVESRASEEGGGSSTRPSSIWPRPAKNSKSKTLRAGVWLQ